MIIKRNFTNKEFLWNALIFWAACFTGLEAPISFVFKIKIQTWQVLSDLIISLFFILDISYQWKERKKMQRDGDFKTNSLNEKLLFLIDLFSCIPFDLLSFLLGFTEIFTVLRIFRLVRIIKIFYLIKNITIVPTIFRIQSISLFFFIVVNWIACGWIMIYPRPAEYDMTTYYIRSFYWALTTLTTIGYGDITPQNNIGMIYTCFVMIIGVGMYGVVIGNITRMMAQADRYKEQTREKMDDLLQFMKHYRVPAHLQQSAIDHYNHKLSKRLSENDEKIIADLPHALQNEMQIYMKMKLVSEIPIFAGCPEECLRMVASSLEQIYTSPKDKIINLGEIGHEMFILAHGSVDIVLENGEHVATLIDGQIFGEIALLRETKRNATVESNDYCDLYKLTNDKFNKIIKTFPVLLSNIERTTNRRASDRKS